MNFQQAVKPALVSSAKFGLTNAYTKAVFLFHNAFSGVSGYSVNHVTGKNTMAVVAGAFPLCRQSVASPLA